MAALMSLAKNYETELFATASRALAQHGRWLRSQVTAKRRPAPAPSLQLNALAAADIVMATGNMPNPTLDRANDNW